MKDVSSPRIGGGRGGEEGGGESFYDNWMKYGTTEMKTQMEGTLFFHNYCTGSQN